MILFYSSCVLSWALNDPFTCLSHPFTQAPGKQEACFIQLLFPDPEYHLILIPSKNSTYACKQTSRQWLPSPRLCHTAGNCPLRKPPTPKFSCSSFDLAGPQLCQDLSRYPFTRSSQVWGMEVVYLPNTMKAMGCSFACPVTSLHPPVFNKNKMDCQLRVMCLKKKKKRESCVWTPKLSDGETVFLQPMFYQCVENTMPFSSHWSSLHSRTSSHTCRTSAQPSTATVCLQIPQPQTTRWVRVTGQQNVYTCHLNKAEYKKLESCVYWQIGNVFIQFCEFFLRFSRNANTKLFHLSWAF